ncbi:tetratricopeptide repeat protein [Sulfitobacter sp.]|uniref:tetratricopeptide repeat protein n=1 Tax=Sulfitobacter sp. TaxID=1903071 RepID=UPI003564539D|tara:strand:+ start:1592 stop:2119 length:528 start_codon:yes stop_codon:yes gene_type:complete
MRVLLASALALAVPTGVFAAGGGDETAPPKPAVSCESGMVYDKKAKKCVTAKDSRLSPDDLYETVRQLAYAGNYQDAQLVLAEMPAQDDRALTYMGFTHRKLGNAAESTVFYTRALQINPANILARSYMAQGMVEEGNIAGAMAELRAIRSYGGQGTWAEASLRTAIATGQTFNY